MFQSSEFVHLAEHQFSARLNYMSLSYISMSDYSIFRLINKIKQQVLEPWHLLLEVVFQ